MTLTSGIVLLAGAVAMLFFGRPSDGVSAPFLKVWVVGQIYAMAAMVAGVMGVTMILSGWPF